MVLTLAIPVRRIYHLEDLVTDRHLDIMAKVMLATGIIVAYGYVAETFMSFYGANEYERYMMMNRLVGPYAGLYWMLVACNIVLPQSLWSRRLRRNVAWLFFISLAGLWQTVNSNSSHLNDSPFRNERSTLIGSPKVHPRL